MISPNGIAHIQLTVRDAAVCVLAFALTACSPSSNGSYEPNRRQYSVSSQPVSVSGVELTFESCSLPQQCDLIVQIANNSDGCIAFNETDLPDGSHVWLDTTFNLPRRMTGYPAERVRQTFVVVQPGDAFREAVDLHAIYDVADLSEQSLTFTTGFTACATLAGASTESFDLVSAPITFERSP